MTSEPGFLGRWSRRKLDEKRTVALPDDGAKADPAAVEPAAEVAPADDRSDAEILADLGLPDPAALKPGDDVSGFMQAAVPDRLRRLALRALWRSNPVLANVDGLVEYGEDYTDAATVVDNLQTLYQAGKGMLFEDETDTSQDAMPEPARADATVSEPPATEKNAAASDETGDAEELVATAEIAPEIPADTPEPTRRRMRFDYCR